jgi:hypothetical protein
MKSTKTCIGINVNTVVYCVFRLMDNYGINLSEMLGDSKDGNSERVRSYAFVMV